MNAPTVGISPAYMRFMVQYVGLTLHKRLMTRSQFTTDENSVLSMIALALSNRSNSRVIFLEQLEDRGDVIVEEWHRFYTAVLRYNSAGCVDTEITINTVMRKYSK